MAPKRSHNSQRQYRPYRREGRSLALHEPPGDLAKWPSRVVALCALVTSIVAILTFAGARHNAQSASLARALRCTDMPDISFTRKVIVVPWSEARCRRVMFVRREIELRVALSSNFCTYVPSTERDRDVP
jgi:hypothetical protein